MYRRKRPRPLWLLQALLLATPPVPDVGAFQASRRNSWVQHIHDSGFLFLHERHIIVRNVVKKDGVDAESNVDMSQTTQNRTASAANDFKFSGNNSMEFHTVNGDVLHRVTAADGASDGHHHQQQWKSSSSSTSEKQAAAAADAVDRRVITRDQFLASRALAGKPLAAAVPQPPQHGLDSQTLREQATQKRHHQQRRQRVPIQEAPAQVVPSTGFNVILTHATADFDSLASAVALAKLWSSAQPLADDNDSSVGPTSILKKLSSSNSTSFDSASGVPTFVVLPRGAHPGVQRFLALHKHLFPIRSLKSLPAELHNLNRLALVDAQRRDRLGPAVSLLPHASRVTVVDHHVDQDSDILADDYVLDHVGSVSTMMTERLQEANLDVTEAEATLLALGIHADTGNLCFDSTMPRDAAALAWLLAQGASQAAIAEHAQSSLSTEQQEVLTQALLSANTTKIHGVTLTTVLLSADGFINGLAAVAQDALDLSSSDIFLLALVYEAQSGGGRRGRNSRHQPRKPSSLLTSRILSKGKDEALPGASTREASQKLAAIPKWSYEDAWKGGELALRKIRLQASFDRKDTDGNGYLDEEEVAAALAASGVIASEKSVASLMAEIDTDGDGRIDFAEFLEFASNAEERQAQQNEAMGRKGTTMIIIGRVKAGVNLKAVKLNKMLEQFGGGGHAKAASATVRLDNEEEGAHILQRLVDELISTSLQEQATVGDFMTAPVLSAQPDMTEKQVDDMFKRYDVRALPVVDENNDVIGLVTYKEVAAAKQRLWNKQQKEERRREREAEALGHNSVTGNGTVPEHARKLSSTVKGWMLQHVQMVEASKTMSEVETILLENDIGCIPVVEDGTTKLVGMVTRTDLLRQHRYYPSLHYHNKGFADSIAKRKPIIELRKRLKRFDIENE